MTNRYAILIDGGFINTKLQKRNKRFPTADDVVVECEKIKSSPYLAGLSLLRIYYYHAPPLTGIIENPVDKKQQDLSASSLYKNTTSLLDKLELKADFALRLGEVSYDGWKLGQYAMKDIAKKSRTIAPRDFVPDINQKGVDLRIGLDMARLSLQRLVMCGVRIQHRG